MKKIYVFIFAHNVDIKGVIANSKNVMIEHYSE